MKYYGITEDRINSNVVKDLASIERIQEALAKQQPAKQRWLALLVEVDVVDNLVKQYMHASNQPNAQANSTQDKAAYDAVIWLDASNEGSLLNSCKKVAMSLENDGLVPLKDIDKADWRTLVKAINKHIKEQIGKRWLVVLNRVGFKELQGYVGADNIDVIITLNKATKPELMAYWISSTKYLDLRHLQSTYTTSQTALNIINDNLNAIYGSSLDAQIANDAKAILSLCIYLHNEDIDKEWLKDWLKERLGQDFTASRFDDAVKYLLDNDILDCDSSGNKYNIGVLTQKVLQDHCHADHAIYGQALEFINTKFSWLRSDYKKELESIDHTLLPHVHAVLDNVPDDFYCAEKMKLYNSLGCFFYNKQGMMHEGYYYFKRAQEVFNKLLETSSELKNFVDLVDNRLKVRFHENAQTKEETLLQAAEKLPVELKNIVEFYGEEVLHNCGAAYLRLVSNSAEFAQLDEAIANLRCAHLIQKYLLDDKDEDKKHAWLYTCRILGNAYQIKANILLTTRMFENVNERMLQEELPIELGGFNKIFNELFIDKNGNLKPEFITGHPESAPLVLMDLGFTLRLLADLNGGDEKRYDEALDKLKKSVNLYKNLDNTFANKNKDLAVALLYLAEVYMAKIRLDAAKVEDRVVWRNKAESIIIEACWINNKHGAFNNKPTISAARCYRHLATLAYEKDKYGLAKLLCEQAMVLHETVYPLNHYYRHYLQFLENKIIKNLPKPTRLDKFVFADLAKILANNTILNGYWEKIKGYYNNSQYEEAMEQIEQLLKAFLSGQGNSTASSIAIEDITKYYEQLKNIADHIVLHCQAIENVRQNNVEKFGNKTWDYVINEFKKQDVILNCGPNVNCAAILGGLVSAAASSVSGISIGITTPIAGITIGGASADCIGKIIDLINQKMQYNAKVDANIIVKQVQELRETIVSFINRLKTDYADQLSQLTDESITNLSNWVGKCIVERLKENMVDSDWPGADFFMKGILDGKERCKLQTRSKSSNSKHWTAAGLFQHCGIVVYEDGKKTYYTRKNKRHDKHPKYDYCTAQPQVERALAYLHYEKFASKEKADEALQGYRNQGCIVM